MVTVLRERRNAEAVAAPDKALSAGSRLALDAADVADALVLRSAGWDVYSGRTTMRSSGDLSHLVLEGFDVATAMDGQDCLATVSAIVPDLITLEEMPRLDAWKTAIRFRKCPGNSRIRLVLITAPRARRRPDAARARQC